MKPFFLVVFVLLFAGSPLWGAQPQSLFDGKSFAGWEGDTQKWWKIENGEIVAGSATEKVPHNDFLATTRPFTNFVLRVKFKLTGSEGFINSGVQFRSERVPNDHEMKGYQADIGEGWYGCLYDESRRNTVLARPAEADVKRAVKVNEWNEYEVRAEGRHITTKINGVLMVDYTEPDTAIPQHGKLGLQIHGGGKAQARFKEITIEVLPN